MSLRSRFAIPVLALFLLFLAGCSGGGSDTTAVTAFDPQTKQLMQSTLDASLATLGVPGAAVTIISPTGAKWVGVSGLSSIENYTPMVPGLKFRLGSVTKMMTSMLILQLVQEGYFSLDASVELIIPGVVTNGANITVRQLLNHTSGLFDYIQAQSPNFFAQEWSNLLQVWTPQALVNIANANTPYFAPGAGFHYSNTNYILLGMIIEKVMTGSTFAQEVTSRIIVPLGLSNTSIATTPAMPSGSTQGYTMDSSGWVNTTTVDASFAWSAGDAISTNDDLIVFLTAVINGTLLNQQLKAEMFTFVNSQGVVTQGSDGAYGLGLEKTARGFIGHTGDFVFGGQAAVYWYDGWMFVVQTNASPPNPIPGGFAFGSEYILSQEATALGLIQ
jgi:D-alanyl-D-alanine carboxypeptidase